MKGKLRVLTCGHQRLLFSLPTEAVGERWFLAVPERSSSAFATPTQGSLHLLTISTSTFYLPVGSVSAPEQYWKWLEPRRSWLPLNGGPQGPQADADLHYYLFFLTRLRSINHQQRSLRDDASASAALHRAVLITIIPR